MSVGFTSCVSVYVYGPVFLEYHSALARARKKFKFPMVFVVNNNSF